MKKYIIKVSVTTAMCLVAFCGPNFAAAQSSASALKGLIESAIATLGENRTEQDIRSSAIVVLVNDGSASAIQSSAVISVIEQAREDSEFLTVRALEDLIYENKNFYCQSVESLVYKAWLGINRLPEDRTEIETQDDIELVLDQCGADDDVVAEALTLMIQTAQLNDDQVTVIALTNLSRNVSEEILEGSAELAQAANSANFVSPVGAPPSGASVGGSDY